jgi:ubiquinone/menaquinone biosynthesis C-methylase UbiE
MNKIQPDAGSRETRPEFSQDFHPQLIQDTYETLARNGNSELCCSPMQVYSSAELAGLPENVLRLSSGCGAPVTSAEIEPGDRVVDIGSGAGADCFLAAQFVGSSGSVIGVDPSPTMRAIALKHRDDLELSRVDFVDGTAERIPLENHSANVVISNCVLSLASDPRAVWWEITRVLRPGGRFVVSDIIGGGLSSPESKTRCETGLTWPEYRKALVDARVTGIEPLRVRTVAFRDGYRAQSLTLRGWSGMPTAHHTAQVFAPARHRAIAQEIVALCGRAGHRRGATLALRTVDLGDPASQSVLRLVLESDFPIWDGETWPSLAIVSEGRLITTWLSTDTQEIERIAFVERALDRLL